METPVTDSTDVKPTLDVAETTATAAAPAATTAATATTEAAAAVEVAIAAVEVATAALGVAAAADAVAALPAPSLDRLSDVLEAAVKELTGKDVTAGEVLRYVPRLAAKVQTFVCAGAEKKALVVAAVENLIDTVVKEDQRATVRAIVVPVLSATIENVIDVVQGRVSFAQAAQGAAGAAVAVAPLASAGCLPFLGQCMQGFVKK